MLLVKRLSLLLWRERRLAHAETRELTVAESDDRYAIEMAREEYETGGEEAGKKAELKVLKSRGLKIPIERQLLVGRYQMMLTNQIRQTLDDIERERLRFEAEIEHEMEGITSAADDPLA